MTDYLFPRGGGGTGKRVRGAKGEFSLQSYDGPLSLSEDQWCAINKRSGLARVLPIPVLG